MKNIVFVSCVAVVLGMAFRPLAQSAAGPVFEVASVKRSDPDAAGPFSATLGVGRIMPPVGGRFTATNIPLRHLVRIAYGLSDFQIEGGPDWQTSSRFDIQAKAEDPTVGMDAMLPMIRALLAERFQLKVHTETREMPIFALVVAGGDGRIGVNIMPSIADCSNAQDELAETVARQGRGALAGLIQAGQGLPCTIMPVVPTRGVTGSMTMRGNGQSMAALARMLEAATGRTVMDRTGMSGLYDWEISFIQAVGLRAAQPPGGNLPLPPTPPPAESPSLMAALQEQLGLKLESTRGPVEVLVIDSAATPEPD